MTETPSPLLYENPAAERTEEGIPPASASSRRDVPWLWISAAVLVIAALGWWAQRDVPTSETDARVNTPTPYQANKPQRFHLKDISREHAADASLQRKTVGGETGLTVTDKPLPETARPPALPAGSAGEDLAALQRKVEAQQQQIAALLGSVSTLEKKVSDQQGNTQSVSALFQQYTLLKNKITNAEAFSPELKTFLEFTTVPDTVREKLGYFKPYSAKGIPSMDQLKLNFDRSIRAFYRDGMMTNYERGEQGFWADAERWLNSLVIIRKVGNGHHDDTDGAVIARAEGHVQQDDIALALDEVQRLSIHALPYFKEWRYDAYAHIGSQKILQDVDMLLFAAH